MDKAFLTILVFAFLCIAAEGISQEKLTPEQLSSEELVKLYIDKDIAKAYDPLHGIWQGTTEMKVFIDKTEMPSSTKSLKLGIISYVKDILVIEIDRGPMDLELTSTGVVGEYYAVEKGDPNRPPIFQGKARLLSNKDLKIVMKGSSQVVDFYLTNMDKGKDYRSLADGTEIFKEIILQRTYPSQTDIARIKQKALEDGPRSGTGFALSQDGYIATNYHVVENSNKVAVRGINGDFARAFRAIVVAKDISNDLAILKIDDVLFSSLGRVPFQLESSGVDVGEDVFVLGYPLISTMGEEIKLTTGIVSSSSGFQGSRNQYQISVPIQPGNSGGPLFDKAGKIAGIVNAKHTNTDNVSYAIKVAHLINLLSGLNVSMPTTNLLANKPLPEKVKVARTYIYLIEVNK